MKDNTIFTYEQIRSGLSYFYCKRKVAPNGIDTEPLTLTMTPWKIPERELFYGYYHPLSPLFPSRLNLPEGSFDNVEEAFKFRLGKKTNWSLEEKRDTLKSLFLEKMRIDERVRTSLRRSIKKPLVYAIKDKEWGAGIAFKLLRISVEYDGKNRMGKLWEEIREIHYNEINKYCVEKCLLCGCRRTDAVFRREQESVMCTTCLQS